MFYKKKITGFKCNNCQNWISLKGLIGTHYRNHCPFCLFSTHVDDKKSGDRHSSCHGLMEPIGLTFKKEGTDKYGKVRQGELMLIHRCQVCDELSINRLAADDEPLMVLKIFEDSQKLSEELKKEIDSQSIYLLTNKDEKEIKTQLFGKKFDNTIKT